MRVRVTQSVCYRSKLMSRQIHLFVRDTKLSQGTAAPFTYHGRANYVSHEGSVPMSVTLALQG